MAIVIGYAGASWVDRNPALQLDTLRAAGCECIYTDQVTGHSETRYQPKLALEALREGDIFVIWALDLVAEESGLRIAVNRRQVPTVRGAGRN